METYWNEALKEYPINSKWKNKATGETYKITEMMDSELGYTVIKLESTDSDSIRITYNTGIHLEFTRL